MKNIQNLIKDTSYSARCERIYLQKKLLKVFDTLSTLNENFNARIKLFQNSNCFIFKHYILSLPFLNRNSEERTKTFSSPSIQFVFLNPVQEEHWCMNYDSENLFSLISIKFLSTGLIGWNSESKSNKYAERVVIGLVIQNSCHHFFYLSSTSVQKVSVRAAYLIW